MKKKCIKLLLISTFLLGVDTTYGAADEVGERKRGTSTIRGSEMRTALVVFKGCLAGVGVIDPSVAEDPDYAPGAIQGQQLVGKFKNLKSELQATRQEAADRLGELQALLDAERTARTEVSARVEAAEAEASEHKAKLAAVMELLLSGASDEAAANAKLEAALAVVPGCWGRSTMDRAQVAASATPKGARKAGIRKMQALLMASLDTAVTADDASFTGGTGGSIIGEAAEARHASSPVRKGQGADKPLLRS